jgi:hypothetical protein
MSERPGAFQALPYLEISDPDAGWSNVTVTVSVTPIDSLQSPISAFQYKRWTPWDMPQAIVRKHILVFYILS